MQVYDTSYDSNHLICSGQITVEGTFIDSESTPSFLTITGGTQSNSGIKGVLKLSKVSNNNCQGGICFMFTFILDY